MGLVSTRLLVLCCLILLLESLAGSHNSSIASKRPKVVNVGALFTFNSTIGRAAKLAIELAVEDVNKNPSILSGIRLNVIPQDTNCSEFLGTFKGIGFLLLFPPFCAVYFFFLIGTCVQSFPLPQI